MKTLGSVAAAAAMACGGALAAEPTGAATEFFNAVIGHYFVTADPAEAAAIDGGSAGPGWVRTGGRFGVFRGAGDAPGLAPVCRFYGRPGVGPNSHFYTSEPAECEQVKRDPGWVYEGIAFHVARPSGGACPAGTAPVYRTYNNGFARNDSNHRFTVDAALFARAADYGHLPEGVVMCSALSSADVAADAQRLLRQATFGPTDAEIARVASMGAAAWIDQQFALPATQYPEYPWVPANRPDDCVDSTSRPAVPGDHCARDNYSLFPLQLEFFRNALEAPDQLRQRVAFALSQIMVTSGVENSRNYAMRHYQQLLVDRAFGNFYDLLLAVTLSPVMGDYLDMANNNKANAATRTEPNENYAREILQLFSVGTWLLNADGTRRRDAAGNPIATYDQEEIEGFAHAFTGWTYPAVAGAPQRLNNPRNYLGTLIPVAVNHDSGAKTLLGGFTLPPNLGMFDELALAHRNIFEHPNVGPFIGRQLIQKLVTSDPSPGYVARVSAVFANNGAGQRGDLRAVVRAILLDPEARGANRIDPRSGKLMEPVLFVTHVARATGASSDGVFFRLASAVLGQLVYYAPSVFNYYPADYVVPGTALPGPEFGVFTSATAIGRANVANALLFSNAIPPDDGVYGATGTRLQLAPYQAVAVDTATLAERLDRNLLGGSMSTAMRQAIASAVNAIPVSDPLNRARTALYLVVTSPQYQVQR